MKILYADASPVGLDPFGDEPCGIRVTATQDVCFRIQNLAFLARMKGLSRIEETDRPVEWLMDSPMDVEPEARGRLPVFTGQLRSRTLNVSGDRFWYEALLGKTDVLIRSDEIYITDLEDGEGRTMMALVEELANEQAIAEWIRTRLKNGDIDVMEDLPVLMARYAMADPFEIRSEIAERIVMSREDQDVD